MYRLVLPVPACTVWYCLYLHVLSRSACTCMYGTVWYCLYLHVLSGTACTCMYCLVLPILEVEDLLCLREADAGWFFPAVSLGSVLLWWRALHAYNIHTNKQSTLFFFIGGFSWQILNFTFVVLKTVMDEDPTGFRFSRFLWERSKPNPLAGKNSTFMKRIIIIHKKAFLRHILSQPGDFQKCQTLKKQLPYP